VADHRADFRAARWSFRAPSAPPAAVGGNEDAGRVVRFRSQEGLNLAARVFDAEAASRLPLLCLPGLSRNSRDFIRLGQFFSRHPEQPRRVVALDYRGRGASEADPNWQNYKPLVEAQDVLAAAGVLGIEKAVIVGTSRGGIIAMLLGAIRPGLAAGVVLNDIGPVIEGTGLARIKKYLSAKRSLQTWDEAVAAIRAIGGTHFPALSEDDWQSNARAAFVETGKGIVPDFDPNLLRTLEGIDFSEKIPVLWPQYASLSRVPVLAIRGEHSDLLSPRTLALMAERHPHFDEMTVRGQGHAPLLRDIASLQRMFAFAQRCEAADTA
jgi:pimeloyl-ACP methyl ester carboxylesterase